MAPYNRYTAVKMMSSLLKKALLKLCLRIRTFPHGSGQLSLLLIKVTDRIRVHTVHILLITSTSYIQICIHHFIIGALNQLYLLLSHIPIYLLDQFDFLLHHALIKN